MILVVDRDSKNVKVSCFKQDGSFYRIILEDGINTAVSVRKAILKTTTKSRIEAISFRCFFGGDISEGPVFIDETLLTDMVKLTEFFSLYVPAMIDLIKTFRSAFQDVPLIAFFENSFFRDLPEEEKCYALPYEYCEKHRVRKWGFHGIFHEENSVVAGLKKRTISIVLDIQTTVSAISGGKPLSISLGYTPLEGIMSRTSCGDLDPGIVFYLMNVQKYSLQRIDDMLKNESGFVGLTGYDISIEDMVKLLGKDKKIDLAFDVYRFQIMKYMAEGMAAMGGVDNIVFSGQNTGVLASVIHNILKDLMFLGVNVGSVPGAVDGDVVTVSSAESEIKALINKMSVERIIFHQSISFLRNTNKNNTMTFGRK